ncbi:MAG: ribbon-helix-helix protein, CopG family [Candidatus Cloacimonetes bacterium]|nr:ribbon-helix-helix protein, CopG family [Candidatus Cloacimonadota bacterium]
MAHTISLRLKDNTFDKLNYLCQELDRSKSYIIKKALEQYINAYSDYQIALERLRNKDDEIISSDELRSKLGV